MLNVAENFFLWLSAVQGSGTPGICRCPWMQTTGVTPEGDDLGVTLCDKDKFLMGSLRLAQSMFVLNADTRRRWTP